MNENSLVWYNAENKNVIHFKRDDTGTKGCTNIYLPKDSAKYTSLSKIIIDGKKPCGHCLNMFRFKIENGIYKIDNPITDNKKSVYKWEERRCAEVGCNEIGLAPVPVNREENSHYCIEHNRRIV